MSPHDSNVEVLTAADAEDRQRRAAGALLARGCALGDRVAFSLMSSADLLCAVLGAARVGLVPVLLNANLLPFERDLLIDDAKPTVTVLTGAELHALSAGEPTELAQYLLTRPMHYTSGTTGTPKGVTTGLWDEATAAEVFNDEADQWSFGPDDVHLVCSPMYHTVSIRFAAGTLLRGGSLVILRHYEATSALSALRELQPTTAFMVPIHLQRLLALKELGSNERFDSLRFLAHAGAPCPTTVKHAAFDRVRPGALWEFYGSTEGQFTACSPEDWMEHPGSVGKARVGRRLTIERNDDADTSANDGVGAIWCAVPEFAKFSYWGNPAATAAAWRGDAFTVGDIGHVDGDGFLYLSGRRDDLIITGGVNVYPAEVEAALLGIDGVDEVAVFALADDEWGQRVCAAVVGTAGLDDLHAAARLVLAPYKRPKQFVKAADLPHTTTGKLLRRQVASHLGLDDAGSGRSR